MKTTTTKLTETRRDVPQSLGLIRASTKRQDIERQHADLGWLEIRYGSQISERLIIEGLSGKDTLNDPDVRRILDKLADPRYTSLSISAIDRLTRPGEEDFTAYSIFQPFAKLHKPIYSKREGYIEPWTSEGHDTCVKAAMMARAERLELRRRSMDAKLVLAKQGVQCAASAPYGYRFPRKQVKRKGEWVIHETEAKIVREIFRRLAVLDWTPHRISGWLNEQKIPAKKGGLWCPRVVRQILWNPAYIGKARFAAGKPHETSITVPAILIGEPAAWFDVAQVSKERNKIARGGRPSPNYLFQHYLWCGLCEARMTGRREGRSRRAYKCSNIDHHTHKRRCLARQIQCSVLDDRMYDDILAHLSDAATVELFCRDYHDAQRKAQPTLGPSAAERLAKLKRDEIAQQRILGDGDLLDMWEQAKKRKLAIQAEIRTLERDLERTAKVTPIPSQEAIRVYCRGLAKARTWTDYKRRRELIERTITKATYANGNYEVEGRIVLAAKPIKSGVQNWDNGIDSSPSFVPFRFTGKVAA